MKCGEFEQQRRIHHFVGLFLIWEDPFALTLAHHRPTLDSVFGRISAVLIIAHNAAEQAVVGCRDVVVVVEQDCRKRRGVDLKFALRGDVGSEHGIKGVDTFKNDERFRT